MFKLTKWFLQLTNATLTVTITFPDGKQSVCSVSYRDLN